MKEYLVRWEIDMSGKSPRDACKEALEMMQDRGSEALFFTVYDKKTGEKVEVDLTDEE